MSRETVINKTNKEKEQRALVSGLIILVKTDRQGKYKSLEIRREKTGLGSGVGFPRFGTKVSSPGNPSVLGRPGGASPKSVKNALLRR